MSRRHRRRRIRRTRSYQRLIVIRRCPWHSAKSSHVALEGELAGPGECIEAGVGRGKVEYQSAGFGVCGVAVKFEVEDCAYVVWGDGCGCAGGVGFVGVFGADGDEGGGGDVAWGKFAVRLGGVGGTLGCAVVDGWEGEGGADEG